MVLRSITCKRCAGELRLCVDHGQTLSRPRTQGVAVRDGAGPQPPPGAQFVVHQDLGRVLRCHIKAFEHFSGVPREILYDRMTTAVLGDAFAGPIVYNDKLLK